MMSKWEMVKLGDVSDINMGQSPSSENYNDINDGIPFYQGNADFGNLHPNVRYYCNKPTKIAYNNDILVSVRAPIGAINIATEKCCIGRGLSAITQKENISYYKYLYYTLKYKKEELISKGTGSTFKAINKLNLYDINIPLPPINTQKYIANTLDKTQEIIDGHKKQIEELDNLIKATFYDMFGDPNDNKYNKKTIEQIVMNEKNAIKRGPFGGSLKKDEFVNEGYLVYEQRHAIHNDFKYEKYYITKEKYEEMSAFSVKPNDLIISCSGVTLGKIAEIPYEAKKGIINQALLKLSLDNDIISNIFFMYLFRDKIIQNVLFGISRGSGIPNFPSMGIIKKIGFICPPIDLQNKFATIATKIEEQKSIVKQSIKESENLFNSLMNKYFN